MKTHFYPSKPYSWIQFPATMKVTDGPVHMTLKFFGEAMIDHYAVERKLAIAPELNAAEFEWKPQFWNSPFTHQNYWVLAFTKYPPALDHMHGLFDVIRDEHKPWIPHITVSKKLFLLVEDQQFKPVECELKFGEIELCLGGPNL